MGLLTAVDYAREMFRRHFPSPGPRHNRTDAFCFEDQGDQIAFGQGLGINTFRWFLRFDAAILHRCVTFPDWVIPVRDALCAVAEAVEANPAAEQLWAQFLAIQWLDERCVWSDHGVPHGTYRRLSSEEYARADATYPHFTVEVTRCPFDPGWLQELSALADVPTASAPPVQPLLEFGDGWVRLGDEVRRVSRNQHAILRVLYDQWIETKETVMKRSVVCTRAEEKYGCNMSESTATRAIGDLPPPLQSLIVAKSGVGYEFFPPVDAK
jgi:hypothetical protein